MNAKGIKMSKVAEENFDLDDDGSIEADKPDLLTDGTYPIKVNFARSTPTVFALFKQYHDRKTINLAPKFQREKVWDNKQKSELIESILMGIPLPLMYFFQDEAGNIQVVDGKQRLSTLFEYMANDGNGFILKDLKILKDLNGKKFKNLEAYQKANIEDYELVVNIIKPPTPDRIKFDIFDRVNRGGTRLNNQQMRNAIYQGKSTELLSKLSKDNWFQKAIDKSISSKFMKDRYIILRAITFRLYNLGVFTENYNSDIDAFLGKSMLFINKMDEEQIIQIKQSFIYSMQNSYKILGKDGFRVSNYKTSDRNTPVNMALFESISYLMSHSECKVDKNRTKKAVLNLMSNAGFINAITTPVDSSAKVHKRFEYMNKILSELKNDH